MLVLDAYPRRPAFLSKAQRDQVVIVPRVEAPQSTRCCYRGGQPFADGDLNASAAGMAWQTIIPDLLEQGHDLEFNVTKEQVTASAARWIVAVADTFAPPSLDYASDHGSAVGFADYLHEDDHQDPPRQPRAGFHH